MEGHDGGAAQKAAEVDPVAHSLALGRDQTDGSGLVVHHADGRLVRDDGGNGGRRGVAGDGDHVQAH